MNSSLQEGIYYSRYPPIGNSLCMVFLKTCNGSRASEVGDALSALWKVYSDLKKGVVKDLAVNKRHLHPSSLSVLIGYGHSAFKLPGVLKKLPAGYPAESIFNIPNRSGGGAILNGSTLKYEEDITYNNALSDEIIIQFIAENEFGTTRAVLETWKFLRDWTNRNNGRSVLAISKIYSGFMRPDMRNWLGFHDGVSNLASNMRLKIIAINEKITGSDKWYMNGTYLAFLRISIDIAAWESLNIADQEIIIGRDKLTGCPLVGIDKSGKPVRNKRCPINGTYEVIEPGNEMFREHPPYGLQRNLPSGVNDSLLKMSHIAKAVEISIMHPYKTESRRIFRQGFNFFEPLDNYPWFRIGLNFVSFQNDANKLLDILKYGFGSPNAPNINDNYHQPLEKFLRVRSAGIYFVPAVGIKDSFPGEQILIEKRPPLRGPSYTTSKPRTPSIFNE